MATTTHTDPGAAPKNPTDAGQSRRWSGWWPPAPWQILALLLAVAFLGGVVGHRLAQPDASNPNAADTGFLDDIITHHEQAISMGFAYIERGGDDWLLNHTAREVVRTQSVENSIMSRLQLEFGGVATPETAMEWMGTPFPQTEMPGLASDEEFDRLAVARGLDADDLFSQLMIRHHRGGIDMAEAAADLAATPEVRELASSMARAQRIEVGELRDRREELGLPRVDAAADSATAPRWAEPLGALCTAAEQARAGNLAGAESRFLDRAHEPLHRLAKKVGEVDRGAAAHLLEAKGRVEGAFSNNSASVPADLDALSDATATAVEAISDSVPVPCG